MAWQRVSDLSEAACFAKRESDLPIQSGSKGASVTDPVSLHGPGGTPKTGEAKRMEAATKPGAVRTDSLRREGRIRRLTTETKQAFKTTEFWGMVGVIAAILVSAAVIKGGDTDGTDEFIARQAWLYVAIVAGAYFIGRGLAKSGSRDPYTESVEDGDRNGR
jgi:hypothetical protein